jgi:superfamily II DNA or RNA helicase
MEPLNPKTTRKLYQYQETDIAALFAQIEQHPVNYRLLYQLPTGGGKTVVFSEIARRYIEKYGKKVIVLTHRIELCLQTSRALKQTGIKNKVVSSVVKNISWTKSCNCYVAMVETLKNRIRDQKIDIEGIGLVIIDEAHHNSFQKLLGEFTNAVIVGVTATPFSSDVSLPMRDNYDQLLVGEDIPSLITKGFLAKPTTWRYDVELNTLKTNANGDFTVSTSDELYSSPAMLDLLVHAYNAHSKGKKTLIFNNGIFASRKVCQVLGDLGYPIRHLDNETSPVERIEILKWLKQTKGAILTSVAILTTGFDEPSVQSVILYRATNSLTLYHQMIGRGARRTGQKKTFAIIDLGNNTDRFGEWSAPLDWNEIFEHPEAYYESINNTAAVKEMHHLPSDMRAKFPNSLELSFDIQGAYQAAIANQQKPKLVIRDAIRQHALMCIENSDSITEATALISELEKEVEWRVKQYGKCLGNVTKNYTEWLRDDYQAKLKAMIQKLMYRRGTLKTAV